MDFLEGGDDQQLKVQLLEKLERILRESPRLEKKAMWLPSGAQTGELSHDGLLVRRTTAVS